LGTGRGDRGVMACNFLFDAGGTSGAGGKNAVRHVGGEAGRCAWMEQSFVHVESAVSEAYTVSPNGSVRVLPPRTDPRLVWGL
jgi:hypothetical protein